MPRASDMPMGKDVDRPRGATIFLSSVSKLRKRSTTRSATFSASSRRYRRGSWEVIPLGQWPMLQMLQRSDSEPIQPAAACMMYFPICTPLAPSMIMAAALAASTTLMRVATPFTRTR